MQVDRQNLTLPQWAKLKDKDQWDQGAGKKIQSDIQKKFSTTKIVEHWNRGLGVMKSPCLETGTGLSI